MTPETVEAALALIEGGEDFVWVTVIESLGSTPRHAGAHMLVKHGGSITGTVGGGALEAAAIRKATEVLASSDSAVVEFDLTGEQTGELGMICGGRGLLLIEHVAAADPAAKSLCLGLRDLMGSGRRGWLVTIVPQGSERRPSGWCLVDSEGSVIGAPILPIETLQELAKKGGICDGLIAAGGSRVHVEPVGPRETVFIFGAGHCGQKLAVVAELVASPRSSSTTGPSSRVESASRPRAASWCLLRSRTPWTASPSTKRPTSSS